LDLVERGLLDLGQVRCCVLDEADRMLDMGFIHAIRRILKLLPRERQTLMFSATYSAGIRALAARASREPLAVEVAPRNSAAERTAQRGEIRTSPGRGDAPGPCRRPHSGADDRRER